MKNKRALFAVPYIVWMAFLVVIPHYHHGGLRLYHRHHRRLPGLLYPRQLYQHGQLHRGLYPLLQAGLDCHFGLPSDWVSYLLYDRQRGTPVSADRHGAHHAAHVDQLPAADLFLDVHSENNGLLNQFFRAIGLIDLYNSIAIHFAADPSAYVPITYFQMMGTSGAVVLGMVYNYLPFMILPIYSVIVKLDHSLIEAAHDLGANSLVVFRKVIFPLSLPGVLSGITMVFVPSVSTFAISRLLGGGNQMLLGDLIELQFTGGAYNPHLGAAIAMVMMVIVVVCMWVMNHFGEGEEQAVML